MVISETQTQTLVEHYLPRRKKSRTSGYTSADYDCYLKNVCQNKHSSPYPEFKEQELENYFSSGIGPIIGTFSANLCKQGEQEVSALEAMCGRGHEHKIRKFINTEILSRRGRRVETIIGLPWATPN